MSADGDRDGVGGALGRAQRALRRRRWFQAGAFAKDLVVIVRLVDHGLGGSGLVWVAEPSTGRTLLEHRIPGIPLANLAVGPFAGPGAEAHVTLPLSRIRLFREARSSAWELTAHMPGHAVSIGLEGSRSTERPSIGLDTRGAPAPMMLVGEPSPGEGALIQRFVGLEGRGTVRIRSEIKSLEQSGAMAAGFLEYGNGVFLRPLMWSSAMLVGEGEVPWAFFSDLPMFGESAVWEAGRPRELGSAELSTGEDRRRWEVSAPSAGASLRFFPRATCGESSGRGGTAMRHALVIGRFEGRLGEREVDVPGLCEARSFG